MMSLGSEGRVHLTAKAINCKHQRFRESMALEDPHPYCRMACCHSCRDDFDVRTYIIHDTLRLDKRLVSLTSIRIEPLLML